MLGGLECVLLILGLGGPFCKNYSLKLLRFLRDLKTFGGEEGKGNPWLVARSNFYSQVLRLRKCPLCQAQLMFSFLFYFFVK
jgi:hypothetical protein